MTGRTRVVVFVAVCAVLALVAAGAVGVGIRRSVEEPAVVVPPGAAAPGALLFLDEPDAGQVGRLSWADPGWRTPTSEPPRHATGLRCSRAYAAAGRGICVTPKGSGFVARLFDATFRPVGDLPLAGTPSRARVSPDGRYGAVTTFVTGDSYADDDFSTRTVLIDMQGGVIVSDLEKFRTTRDGTVVDAPDVNYWGVTFEADGNRFYATLGYGDATYLVHGDVAARTAEVVHDNVECPSLSPDGSRVAFKKLVGDEWHFTVLDLASGQETPLAEPGAIDEQLEWLDDRTVAYGTALAEVWSVPADGSGAPQRLLTSAQSPAAVR